VDREDLLTPIVERIAANISARVARQ
jgi:hypothetical protein